MGTPEDTSWDRLTVNVEPALANLARARAKQRRQSLSSYVATLLERDVMLSAGAQAPYGATTDKIIDQASGAAGAGQPPKPPKRRRRGGPKSSESGDDPKPSKE